MKPKPIHILALPVVLGILSNARAADVVVGDITTSLGPNFFFDTAAIGGGDFNAVDAYFNRDFGVNGYDPAGTQVTITGVGWASPANQVLATTATITITHLGADNVVGGGDDTVVGTATDAIPANSSGGERVWQFSSPMVANISGTGSRFLIRIQGNANIRYKTTSTSAQTAADAKISVAGSFNGGALPDTDGDGIANAYETNTGVFLSRASTGTDPALADTDADGLNDFAELYTNSTDPGDPDTDNDGLGDGAEILTHLTNALNRDSDNDGLSDGQEVGLGLNALANADFDNDGFSDTLETLFYGSNPKLNTSFPGDGNAPAPGTLTPILNAGAASIVGNTSGNLGTVFVDEAATGGAVDADFSTGRTTFALHYDNLFPAAGSSVSITGFAWPVIFVPQNQSGDILVQFFDPGPGNANRSIDQATLVGTARGTLTMPAATTVMYWNFAQPVNFTSSGTGLIVKIQSTASLRIKAQNQGSPAFASGIWRSNDGRNTFGTLQSSRISLGGTITPPPAPAILSIVRTGNTTTLTWDRDGAPTVTLQRSTSLEPGSFINVPSRTNTTETSYQETSGDPKAFFRLATP